MNRLFVVNKPIFVSSNRYMGYVKRKYNTKKVGFSGTLDPFATGCLIVATGQYTKLFQYLDKSPKSYKATLWLGAKSASLDIENVVQIDKIPPFSTKDVEAALSLLQGEICYYPPKFSAKKIDGKRAYRIARDGEEVDLRPICSTVYEIKLLCYNHPFIHFEATVSEGTYIRSLGEMIAQALGVYGALSSLTRIREGKFCFEDEKALDPFKLLTLTKNSYLKQQNDIERGIKLSKHNFLIQKEGLYLVETTSFYAIISIEGDKVHYKLNRLEKFKK